MARSRQAGGGESAIRLVVGAAAEADGEGGTRDERLGRKLCNDMGNAERFRGRYGSDFLVVTEIGWHAWVKTHWSAHLGDRLSAIACQKTVAKIFDEAIALEALADVDKAKISGLRSWGVKSGNRERLSAMRDVAAPMMQRDVGDLDSDPLLFNVQNGTLELGERDEDGTVPVRLRRQARRDLITRISPVGFDPAAECPQFLRFVAWALPDAEVRLWVQKLFGYCLTGLDVEHMLAAFWGKGRNGKGTLAKLFLWLYGDYASPIEFASLLSDGAPRRGGDATPDLARLTGKRAVFASEPRRNAKLDDGKVKQITGGDPLMVRHLNHNFFDLLPTFKLILSFNNKPKVDDDSHGMWSRMRLVPFTATIAEDAKDEYLLDKLKSEGPGILNWALDGYRLWREEGLAPPPAMAEAAAKYRLESDRITQFIADALVRSEGDRLQSSHVYACYVGWCKANEINRPVSQKLFSTELEEKHGIVREKSGVMWCSDLKWKGECDWDWEMPY